MDVRKYFKSIDRKLLPVKVHYFLFLAALACVLPFRTVFAKQLGISATAVGVIFFAVPFMRILSNPLCGVVLDYFKRFRLTISVIMIIVALSHIAMVFIPPKTVTPINNIHDMKFHSRLVYSGTNESEHSIHTFSDYMTSLTETENSFGCSMECSDSKSEFLTDQRRHTKQCGANLRFEYTASIYIFKCDMDVQIKDGKLLSDKKQLSNSVAVHINKSSVFYHRLQSSFFDPNCSKEMPTPSASSEERKDTFAEDVNIPREFFDFGSYVPEGMSTDLDNGIKVLSAVHTYVVKSENNDWFSNYPCKLDFDCNTKKCFRIVNENNFVVDGIKSERTNDNEYISIQFWALFILITVSSQSFSAIMFMMDTVCYELLQDRKGKYGQQRLWGTVGWGVGALAGGYLNQIVSPESGEIYYAPSFFLLAVIALLDLFPIYQLRVTDLKYSSHIWKDVCLLLVKADIVYNIIIVYFIGVLSGFIWNYQFWFMEEIGASQVLLGLSQAFECIFELPWFIVSGWIIKKIGHGNCNSLTLFSFGLRYLCFAFMYDPWMTLPVALIHGPSFGLFYASLTMYAKNEARPGTEATVQSLMHLCFEGVGVATGVILGGIGFDSFGSRMTFVYATEISFLLFFVNMIMTLVFYRLKTKSKNVEIDDKSLKVQKQRTDTEKYSTVQN